MKKNHINLYCRKMHCGTKLQKKRQNIMWSQTGDNMVTTPLGSVQFSAARGEYLRAAM